MEQGLERERERELEREREREREQEREHGRATVTKRSQHFLGINITKRTASKLGRSFFASIKPC
jgi:hypothetical protein